MKLSLLCRKVENSESYAGLVKEIRGYLEDKEVQKEESTKVLEQTVSDINLVDVIKAINNIGEEK